MRYRISNDSIQVAIQEYHVSTFPLGYVRALAHILEFASNYTLSQSTELLLDISNSYIKCKLGYVKDENFE